MIGRRQPQCPGIGLSITYTSYNRPATITRGTTSISFDHDPEHQRYAQAGPNGATLYFQAFGVLAERFGGLSSTVRWTNYLIVGGRLIGIHVENSDETTLTRYFHTDHLGSIAVITNEVGAVVERLSYDAWGVRRHSDGTPDPAGSIASSASRGFTGHEHLADVGLIHMNGRVYDPLLARFGTPRPHDGEPVLHPGLEPLQLRRQLPRQLHRPHRLLLHGLLLAVTSSSTRSA